MRTGLELSLPAMPDYFEKLEARIRAELAEGVAAWGQSVTDLSRWEAKHLLDNPSSETLAIHRRTVERLIRFGGFIARTTDHADFPDAALKANVQATLQTLRDKLPLWHGDLSETEAEAILQGCFPP